MNHTVEIIQEHEHPGAWVFDARIDNSHARSIRIAWQDYEDWSRGTIPPHTIAKAALLAILQHHDLDDLPVTFDAARYRRLIADFDTSVLDAISE